MIKKLVSLLVLTALLAMGGKMYATYQAYTIIEAIKADYAGSMTLDYEWLSVGFDGQVRFEELDLTVFPLKRTFHMDSFTLSFQGMMDVMNTSPDIWAKGVSNDLSLSVENLSFPYKGKPLSDWLKEQYSEDWLVPFGLYECGAYKELDYKFLKTAGIDHLVSDLTLRFTKASGQSLVKVVWYFEQLGQLEFDVQYQNGVFSIKPILDLFNQFDLSGVDSISVNYTDQGLVRRVRNICELDEQDVYPEVSSIVWQEALKGVGIQSSDQWRMLYSRLIREGGRVSISVDKPQVLQLEKVESLFGKNLAKTVDLQVTINDTKLESLAVSLIEEHFTPKDLPVEKEVVRKSEYKAQYRYTTFSELNDWIDKRARVKLLEGKVYEGVLRRITKDKLEIEVSVSGGLVIYNVKAIDIDRIEIWR